MDTKPTVTVFISYSHRDKVVARRLLRELGARGFRVWLDERDLRLGAALTTTIREQIEACDVVLVIASAASADSSWVGMELEHARAHGRPIVPLLVEPVADRGPFHDHKGVEVPSPQAFGRAVLVLMRGVMQAFDRELPAADLAALETGLQALVLEERALEPLVVGCLDGEGVNRQHQKSVFGASFHALDHALNALMELRPTHSIAQVAAEGFATVGAGYDALRRWIERSGDGGMPLVFAVGDRLDRTLLAPALDLLGACSPPNNHALYNFIHRNADQIDAPTRRVALHLVTWPRRGPDRLGDTLGRVALEHFPDAADVRDMWVHWIYDGQFDGKPGSPGDLARELGIAHERKLQGWGPVQDALRNHVRGLLRKPSRERVWTAIHHLQANADERTPVVNRLARELEGVSATAEWEHWAKDDPQSVEVMRWYVHTHARESQGNRDWLKAIEDAERVIAFEKERKARLAAPEGSIG